MDLRARAIITRDNVVDWRWKLNHPAESPVTHLTPPAPLRLSARNVLASSDCANSSRYFSPTQLVLWFDNKRKNLINCLSSSLRLLFLQSRHSILIYFSILIFIYKNYIYIYITSNIYIYICISALYTYIFFDIIYILYCSFFWQNRTFRTSFNRLPSLFYFE